MNDANDARPERPVERLVGRLRELADEIMSRPHPTDCDHLHFAFHAMKQAADEIERLEALCDLSYANGIAAGWNCETAEQRMALTERLRGPALAVLRSLRPND